ncbi:anaerobic ribonucleoside triphosphate reductase [Marinicrinis sediminis]|uniref:Anaerobic ribonucleoside triphosphate reductase n=1 Tax=Marinicrinis sediminis TaxID=1652465 RepID=A0ABW5R951_9BACL
MHPPISAAQQVSPVEKEAVSQLHYAFHQVIQSKDQELLQENANMDGRSPCGMMSKLAGESAKYYARQYLLREEARQAMADNLIHLHDLDYYASGTTTCCQIPLGKLLQHGFNTGHGHMRTPGDITSAMALATILFQSNQNMQHGGQSFAAFDHDLAPYIRKTYKTWISRLSAYPVSWTEETLAEQAWKETDRTTYQACEAFIHNLNSMHSRGGGQIPFTSINYGTDTSAEGRLLTRNLLLATQAGLGHGETPVFPIQIFKMKKGVNFEASDPNYDLYELALETTARRLFPNFSFLDASFNRSYYEMDQPYSEVSYMGCRTRVMGNRHGTANSIGRGNLSFTSVNLVKLALLSANPNHFFHQLDQLTDVVVRQLLERYDYQARKCAGDFSFLYSQGVWTGGEQLKPTDPLAEILKQGTLSLGFIGLAECLKALTGSHHGESESSWKLGNSIVSFMRHKMDQASERHDLNFTLIATPAEGLSGTFTRHDQITFGRLEGITDRDYYTNSFHIPVHFPVKAIDKIRLEGPFHSLCNAGHITYIELDGEARKNIEALDTLVKCMAEHDIGYGSINHPVDRCQCCGYEGIIEQACPRCLISEEDRISRIRRITGYLVGDLDKWNAAKRSEERQRVRHGLPSREAAIRGQA